MIVTCMECDTQFAVASGAIGEKGRRVKCGSCGYIWFQKPLEDLTDTSRISPEPVERFPLPRGSYLPVIQHKYHTEMGLKAGLMLLLFLAVFSGILAHPMPYFERIYETLGLYSTDGLALNITGFDKERENSRLRISVTGEIINEAEEDMPLPPISITFLTRGGNILKRNTVNLERKFLAPNESIPFNPIIENVSGSSDRMLIDIGNKWELLFRD